MIRRIKTVTAEYKIDTLVEFMRSEIGHNVIFCQRKLPLLIIQSM